MSDSDYLKVTLDEKNFRSEFVRASLSSLIDGLILKPSFQIDKFVESEFDATFGLEKKRPIRKDSHRRTSTDLIKSEAKSVIREFNLLIKQLEQHRDDKKLHESSREKDKFAQDWQREQSKDSSNSNSSHQKWMHRLKEYSSRNSSEGKTNNLKFQISA